MTGLADLKGKNLDYIKGFRRYLADKFELLVGNSFSTYKLNRGDQVIPYGKSEEIHTLGNQIDTLDAMIAKRSRCKTVN